VALADTIKVLNDDDALDLFKKTLPGSSSLVQVSASNLAERSHVVEAIRAARKTALSQDRASLDLLTLALTGKKAMGKGGFDKVIKMIDGMVATLKTEQEDDANKKEYCGVQLDSTDHKRRGLEQQITQAENSIAAAKDAIATLTEEIATLEKGIKDMDKSVSEATEQRKEENAEFKELMASNTAAKEVLGWAKNRLNKFYNPKLYKASPKEGESEESGGIAGTGITAPAFVQVSKHSAHKDAPAPPPETWSAYSKKAEENSGVMAMMNLLIRDLDKEITEAETEEKHAQADYEMMLKESAAKRAADSKSLTEKSATKADVASDLEEHKDAKESAGKEHMATLKYIASLHSECDWLLQYFDVRKEARSGEIDALVKAKAVLSSASLELVQTKAHNFLAAHSA